MKTLIPAIASRLFITASLLTLAACGHEEGLLDEEAESIDTQERALGNACKNVDITIVNSLPFPIEVRSVDYYNASEGRWEWEDLANAVVPDGWQGTWEEDLGGAQDERIDAFIVNYVCHGSHNRSVQVNTPDQTCIANANYIVEVQ